MGNWEGRSGKWSYGSQSDIVIVLSGAVRQAARRLVWPGRAGPGRRGSLRAALCNYDHGDGGGGARRCSATQRSPPRHATKEGRHAVISPEAAFLGESSPNHLTSSAVPPKHNH